MDRTFRRELTEACERAGFYVDFWAPGDGKVRYRFFSKPSRYNGPENGDFTAPGKKEALAYARGRGAII